MKEVGLNHSSFFDARIRGIVTDMHLSLGKLDDISVVAARCMRNNE